MPPAEPSTLEHLGLFLLVLGFVVAMMASGQLKSANRDMRRRSIRRGFYRSGSAAEAFEREGQALRRSFGAGFGLLGVATVLLMSGAVLFVKPRPEFRTGPDCDAAVASGLIPEDCQAVHAHQQLDAARAAYDGDDPDAALVHAATAVESATAAEDTKSLIGALRIQADLATRRGQYEDAERYRQQQLAAAKKAARAAPEDLFAQDDLAGAWVDIGNLASARDDKAEARRAYREGVRTVRLALEHNPDSVNLRWRLATLHWSLGSLGDRALERMRMVVSLLEALDAEGKLLAKGQQDLATARREVTYLEGLEQP